MHQPVVPNASSYTAPTLMTLEKHAGLLMASHSPSLPEAASTLMPASSAACIALKYELLEASQVAMLL